MRTLALLLLATSIANADPDPKLLAKGRDLEGKGKHAEAIAAYEQYLKAAPDDAVANGELGFAALQAKDLVKAEAATRLAIAHAPKGKYAHDPDGRARGAALFNLGLVQEAQAKPKDAAVSYRESLASRPSRAVREKLQKVDAGLAAVADPLAPQKLFGPFKAPADACRAWLKRQGEDEASTWGEEQNCDKPELVKVKAGKLAKPFSDVKAMEWESRSAIEILVKLDEGWYHFEYQQKGDRSPAHCGGTAFTVKVLPASATAPQLRLEYTASNSGCDHGGNGHSRSWGWDETGVIAIGVGLAGHPLAPPVLVTSLNEWQQYDDAKKQIMTTAKLSLAWGKDGSLDVTGTLTHPPEIQRSLEDGDLDAENVLGHHVLAFP